MEESLRITNSEVEEVITIEDAKAAADKAKAHQKTFQEVTAALQANESQENNAQESTQRPTILDPDRVVTK